MSQKNTNINIRFDFKNKKYNYEIKKFNFNIITYTPNIILIAKRGSGKSFLIADILYNFKDIPIGAVFSETEKLNKFYSQFVYDIFIHDGFKEKTIQNILNRQIFIKNNRDDIKDKRCFIVMDDCEANRKVWEKTETIQTIFKNGRHYEIFFIMAVQYVMNLKIDFRSNIDFVFILKETNETILKKIYNNFVGDLFPNEAIFRKVVEIIFEKKYRIIIIVNMSSCSNFNERVFWYKAEPRSEWMIGSKQVEMFHKYNYDPDKLKKNNNNNLDDFAEYRLN